MFWWLPFGKVPEIDPHALHQAEGIQIVDVRTSLEYSGSHIEGAANIPITHFSTAAVNALKLDRHRPVVAICLTAHRSIPAVRRLRHMGFDAKQFAGGMRSWWRLKLPTV